MIQNNKKLNALEMKLNGEIKKTSNRVIRN